MAGNAHIDRKIKHNLPIRTRFNNYVDKKCGPTMLNMPNRCWVWTGAKHKDGRGAIRVKGQTLKAHRLAYTISVGIISNHLSVLHECDNPQCVRPSHLFLGTQADNIYDMREKGRAATGQLSGRAKLTNEQVRTIRRKYATGNYTQIELAVENRIKQPQVSWIVNHKGWKDV